MCVSTPLYIKTMSMGTTSLPVPRCSTMVIDPTASTAGMKKPQMLSLLISKKKTKERDRVRICSPTSSSLRKYCLSWRKTCVVPNLSFSPSTFPCTYKQLNYDTSPSFLFFRFLSSLILLNQTNHKIKIKSSPM